MAKRENAGVASGGIGGVARRFTMTKIQSRWMQARAGMLLTAPGLLERLWIAKIANGVTSKRVKGAKDIGEKEGDRRAH